MTKEEYNEYMRIYYKNNKDKILKRVKKYRSNNIEKIKIYYENNKEKINKDKKEYMKIYYENNKEKIKKNTIININKIKHTEKYKNKRRIYKNKWMKNKLQTDPLFKLKCIISNSIRTSLKDKGFKKTSRTHEILGCSFEFFKQYIEKQFEPWMNWNNHVLYNGELNYGWDLDHIIPISIAYNEEEIYKLNNYSNFQPLCSKVNRDIKKNN